MSPLIRRLTEGTETPTPLPIIQDTRPETFWRCPHCKQEIFEKHTYVENGVDYHTECKKPIQFPPTDWSKIDPAWRKLLEPHMPTS